MNEERIFLDHASTTPTDPEVASAMRPYQSERFANPSALYREGVEAREAVADARVRVARILHCRAEEVLFTGSGTESDNLAILGAVRKHWNEGRNHVVTTSIEHPAVLEACRAIESNGGKASYVPVGEDGIVRAQDVAEAVTDETVLVSVCLANNEIGTIQPVGAVSRAMREKRGKGRLPYLHVDASQAANYVDVSVARLGCDLLTLDGSKIYGPKGVGCLFVRKGVELAPLMFGGGQEKGLRPSTENVSGIVGFAKALELAAKTREAESERLTKLRDRFIDEILKKFPNAALNGSREERLPNNVNVCFPGLDAEFAVLKLDAKGIACSAASSCKNLSDTLSSYVIEALGRPECASSSLRFTLGRRTAENDIERAIRVLVDTIGTR